MPIGLVTISYLGAIILFILSLSGLSNQKTASRGNLYGIAGMVLAIFATIFSPEVESNISLIIVAMLVGGSIGILLAKRVEMTQMPELVAILHSLIGLAAVIVAYSNFMDSRIHFETQAEQTVHAVEVFIGIFIGAFTFSGSIVAFAKLSGTLNGQPMLLPARHWQNLILLLAVSYLAYAFLADTESPKTLSPLILMTIIALTLGVHMVIAIGGADMPVVISMLNSYSGWAASATGFMLSNDLLIVTGALVGSSGAILSYIMCRAMNRNFFSVILGGFGSAHSQSSTTQQQDSDVSAIQEEEVAKLLLDAKTVMIIPGYGMAVAQAQHSVNLLTQVLRDKDINVRFAIHPVAGRMPGHMNVLLAEANVPYDIVYEMDEINGEFPDIDVSIVIGANDIVNPSALDDPASPIAGMPVLKCWEGNTTIVLKRSMANGYADIQNPLFYKDNTRMYFGDAQLALQKVLPVISN